MLDVDQSEIYDRILGQNVVDEVYLNFFGFDLRLGYGLICKNGGTSGVDSVHRYEAFRIFVACPLLIDGGYTAQLIQKNIFSHHVVRNTEGLQNKEFSFGACDFTEDDCFKAYVWSYVDHSIAFFDETSHCS